MKFFFFRLLILCFIISGPVGAANRTWVDYNHLLGITYLDRFYSAPISSRDKLIMLGTMQPNNKAIVASEVVLTIVSGNESYPIRVQKDGRFSIPYKSSWVQENPQVLTSMPQGEKAGFSFHILPILPDALKLDYVSFMASVKQANALIKEKAGMMRFLMPKFIGLELQFPEAHHAQIQIIGKRGVKLVSADAQGVIRLLLNKDLMEENVEIILSETPQVTEFMTD